MSKDFLAIVKERRSTRQFSDAHLSDETIRKILEAAAYAPSSWGGHPVEFIVVRDKALMGKLARCKAMGAGPLAYGEAAIVPIIDTRNLELWVEDAAVASTYILLAAEYYGVGACWIHMKDRKGDRIKFPVISIFQQNSCIHIYYCAYGCSAGNFCKQGNLRTFLCDYAVLSNIAYTNVSANPRKGHTGTAEQDIRALLNIPNHNGILLCFSLRPQSLLPTFLML